MRIGHISDLHVVSPRGLEWRRALFNKRMTGYANLVLQRGRVSRRQYLDAVLRGVERADHVVVTGDITNLSLESEFEAARELLDRMVNCTEVTVVPGNHDIYLPSIHHERRFPNHFRAFLRSDLPEVARDLAAGPFPCVKLRGPVAIIALSSAVPRPPFVSSGRIGAAQLAALESILAHPEVVRRTPVLLLHHPPVDDRLRLLQLRDGLVDAASFRAALSPVAHGLVLFGHLHLRVRYRLVTAAGALHVVAASGAGLDHPDPAVRAGYNEYTIEEDGRVTSVEAHVIATDGRSLVRVPLLEDRSV